MGKFSLILMMVLLFAGLGQAQTQTQPPEFPTFAQGHWRKEVRYSYVLEVAFLKDRVSYAFHLSDGDVCEFDILTGDNVGEYKYILKGEHEDCNSGIFTLSPGSSGQLNINWRRLDDSASGIHKLSLDEEKTRAYWQEIGLYKPVLATAELQGEWAGVLVNGWNQDKTSLAATAEGAKLEVGSCETMIYPTSTNGMFDAFLSSGYSCIESENISLQHIPDGLEVTLHGSGAIVALKRVSGPLDTMPKMTVPVAFRNIALGMNLDDIETAIEGEPNITPTRNLYYDLNAGTGAMGVSLLPFLEVDYRTVHYPAQVSGEPERDEDNIAAFATNGQVIAIMRSYRPVRDNRASFDAFKEAVLKLYGAPSIEAEGGQELQWHYAPDGTQFVDALARELCTRPAWDNSSANSRQIGMEYRAFDNDGMSVGYRQYIRRSAYTVRPMNGCGLSVIFSLGRSTDGAMTSLFSLAFMHEPVASAIWAARQSRIESEIVERLVDRAKRDANTPKL